MLIQRALDAVTPWRVFLFLLFGAFAEELASVLRWLVSIGWQLKDDPSLRGLLVSGVVLAVQVGLICWAARGGRRLLDRRRRREPMAIAPESAPSEYDPIGSLRGAETTEAELLCRLREGDGNGHAPNHR